MNDDRPIILWLDDPCTRCHGAVVVRGPVYGQGRDYFVGCLDCTNRNHRVRSFDGD